MEQEPDLFQDDRAPRDPSSPRRNRLGDRIDRQAGSCVGPSRRAKSPGVTDFNRGYAMLRRAFDGLAAIRRGFPQCLGCLVLPAQAADSLPDLKGPQDRRGNENAYFPLNFTDPKTGRASDGNMMPSTRSQRLNATVDWKTTSWDSMIQAVQNGQFDIGMDGISITDERKKQVDSRTPYMVSEQFMLVGRTRSGSLTPKPSRPTRSSWSVPRLAPRISTSLSPTSSPTMTRARA